jgi:hypothetical protein
MENITVFSAILLLCNLYIFSIVLEAHFTKKRLSVSVLSAFTLAIIFAFTSFSALNEYTYKVNGVITNAKIVDQKRTFGNYFSPSTSYNVTYSFKDRAGFVYKNTSNIQANKFNTSSSLNDRMQIQYVYGNPYKNRISTESAFMKYLNFSLLAAIGVFFCLYRKRFFNFTIRSSYLELAMKLKSKH